MLDELCADKKNQDERHNEKNEPECESGVVSALGELEQVTQTSSCCDEFAHHGSGEGEADRDFQAAQHPGGDRRNIDLAQQGHASAAKGPHSFDQELIDVLDAAVDGEKYEHRNENHCESDLRRKLDAEPDDE